MVSAWFWYAGTVNLCSEVAGNAYAHASAPHFDRYRARVLGAAAADHRHRRQPRSEEYRRRSRQPPIRAVRRILVALHGGPLLLVVATPSPGRHRGARPLRRGVRGVRAEP